MSIVFCLAAMGRYVMSTFAPSPCPEVRAQNTCAGMCSGGFSGSSGDHEYVAASIFSYGNKSMPGIDGACFVRNNVAVHASRICIVAIEKRGRIAPCFSIAEFMDGPEQWACGIDAAASRSRFAKDRNSKRSCLLPAQPGQTRVRMAAGFALVHGPPIFSSHPPFPLH